MSEHQTTEYKSSWHDDYLDFPMREAVLKEKP